MHAANVACLDSDVYNCTIVLQASAIILVICYRLFPATMHILNCTFYYTAEFGKFSIT